MPHNDDREHVSLWHPWLDKPGQRHKLALWSDFNFSSIDQTVEEIGNGQYYAICNDILDKEEVNSDILKDERTTAYLSRSGAVAALKVRSKRKNGFLIPGIQWKIPQYPISSDLEKIQTLFQIFGYEAITPSSLSEKVLRSTLPERTYISRPNAMLRRSLIDNSMGGRIDKNSLSCSYPNIYEYDLNKAYLHFSRRVPSPFYSPLRFYGSNIWQDMPVSWVEVTMTAHGKGIQPIQLHENDVAREPRDGETFTKWLWSGEIEDCLKEGYTLNETIQGYSWIMMSDFMARWSDILWNKYNEYVHDDEVAELIKLMMQGLPGRFQKRPEEYTLIHRSDAKLGDIPIVANWLPGQSPMTEWLMRVEPDLDSAQLTPQGHFIVTECRREVFRTAKEAERQGNKVVRIYVDSISTVEKMNHIKVGKKRGEYKLKVYRDAKISHGRFIGTNEQSEKILKAPGISGAQRERMLEKECLELETKPP